MQYVILIEGQKYTIISRATEKSFDRIQQCLTINTFNITRKRRELSQPEKQLLHKTNY